MPSNPLFLRGITITVSFFDGFGVLFISFTDIVSIIKIFYPAKINIFLIREIGKIGEFGEMGKPSLRGTKQSIYLDCFTEFIPSEVEGFAMTLRPLTTNH